MRCIFGMKLFFRWAHLNLFPAVPGSNGVCGPSLPATGMAFADAPFRPAGDPVAHSVACVRRLCRRPSGGRSSRLQSFICCGPTSPKVWPRACQAPASKPGDGWHLWRPTARRQSSFLPLLGTERSKGKRRHPFHGLGRAAKGRSCGFFDQVCIALSRLVLFRRCFRGSAALFTAERPNRPKSGMLENNPSNYWEPSSDTDESGPRTVAHHQGARENNRLPEKRANCSRCEMRIQWIEVRCRLAMRMAKHGCVSAKMVSSRKG